METNWNKYWFQFISNNMDKDWEWEWLSENPNITWEIVEANPDKPWDWYGLSSNPNITWEIVEANPDKPWKWYRLSSNKFTKEKEIIELRLKHQEFVQEELLEEFVKVYMHPKRIELLLNLGYSIDELDDIM